MNYEPNQNKKTTEARDNSIISHEGLQKGDMVQDEVTSKTTATNEKTNQSKKKKNIFPTPKTISVRDKIISHLKESHFWTPKTYETGDYIRSLICPYCDRDEAWAYIKEPWSIICPRGKNCGQITKTLDLFPQILRDIEKDYPPTKQDPNRPATEYLNSRGLYQSLKGLKYKYQENIRGCGSGGVMFDIGSDIQNGRIFNPPLKIGKTHNIGKTGGVIFKHPGFSIDPDKEVYVTESIIDTLSLIELGLQAISILSVNQDPNKINISECKKIVLAFDGDRAGRTSLKKWINHYPGADAILPIKGDWNDLILGRSKKDAIKYFNENKELFKFQAGLALVKDAEEYAKVYSEHKGHAPGLFIFDEKYYYSSSKGSSNKINTYSISTFLIEPDHIQLDESLEDEPIHKFCLKIKPVGKKLVKCVVSAEELSSPQNLTKMFLKRANVVWSGEKAPSIALLKHITNAIVPKVRQIVKIGYDKKSGWYIFKNFAINNKGNIIELNKTGFFQISLNNQIRPSQEKTLQPSKGIEPKKIYNLIYRTWGNSSSVAIAWVIASWFVHDIKEKIGFFPFLSLWGDSQTGKTTLTKILNAFQCIDEEGLPLSKENTSKGRLRTIAKRSALFQALLEATKEEATTFDPNSILTLYNDNRLQVKAKFSNDLQTDCTDFSGSLLFVQNREIFNTKPQKERVISLRFKEKDITEETGKLFDELISTSHNELAYFFQSIMQYREKIEETWYSLYECWKSNIKDKVKDNRITGNYALVLAFHELIHDILKIDTNIEDYIIKIARKKVKDCRHRDEDAADQFFDLIFNNVSLQNDKRSFWIDNRNNKTYIHLNGVLQAIEDSKIVFKIQTKDLIPRLKEHPAYLNNNINHKFINKQHKAWIFNTSKIDEIENE